MEPEKKDPELFDDVDVTEAVVFLLIPLGFAVVCAAVVLLS
jgi:hypothetical protein